MTPHPHLETRQPRPTSSPQFAAHSDAGEAQHLPRNEPSSASPSTSANYTIYTLVPIATLISIATIIGSGILALPVTLHHTSMKLFLLVFTVVFLAMAGAICASVEIFQRVCLRIALARDPNDVPASTPLQALVPHLQIVPSDATLTAIAHYFLPNIFVRLLFHVTTLLSFLSLLISYGLAGTQALWQMVNPTAVGMTPPTSMFLAYTVIGSIAVIFFVDALLPFFSSLTVLKGALFVAVVVVVGTLPPSTHVSSLSALLRERSATSSAVVPFLMAIVALGGMSNTMPVTFSLLPVAPTKRQVGLYRGAVLAGLTICYMLNIGWVFAIMQVVPRDGGVDGGSGNLAFAFEHGEISTVPLIETLRRNGEVSQRVLVGVSATVEAFIVVSTGVSFFVMAAGCKNYMDGFAMQALEYCGIGGEWVVRGVMYVLSFGSVIATVVLNPEGFIEVLTRLTALMYTVQSGTLLLVMLYRSQVGSRANGRGGEVALAMSRSVTSVILVFGGVVFGVGMVVATVAPLIGMDTVSAE